MTNADERIMIFYKDVPKEKSEKNVAIMIKTK